MARKLALLCLPLWAVPPAFAQEITDESLFVDNALPMVLTASRMTQSPLDAPAPVTIIDREMIRASGFTEVQDLMRLVPGFMVADWPSGPPMVVNNGLGDANSRRLQVLLDGRSVYNPFNGTVDWSSLPIRVDDIERIEVVRGPNPATYGANSFQGVVNIITLSPRQEHGKSVMLSSGTGGTREAALRAGNAEGPLEWRLSLSRREAVNYRDLGVDNYNLGESIQRDVLNGQIAYQLNSRDELRFQVGMTRSDDTTGAIIDTSNPPHPRTGQNNFFQAAWRRSTAADEEMSLQYYHFDSQAREPYLVDATVPVNLDVNMRRDDLEFQQTHPLASNLRSVWGAGVRQDKVSSDHYLAGEGEVGGTQWQVFGNLAWQAAPKWLINAGGMVEKHYFTDTLFSPRLAANYSFLPSHVLRASTGRGYRAPTAFEELSREEYVYNGAVVETGYWGQHLKPEQVDFREIGYVGYFQEMGLRVDARLFWNDYQNYIDDKTCRFAPTPDQFPCSTPAPANYTGSGKAFQFINSGNISVEGREIQLDWRNPLVGRMVLGYAHTHIGAERRVDQDVPKSAPVDSISLLWLRNLPGRFAASVGFYALTPMMWLNDGDKQPAYHRTDIRLAKQFGKRESGNEVALTLQNTGGNYAEFRTNDYVVERRSFVTLRLGW
ncbi:hypothetical protein SKTS_14290 [Sulfurimicrobium lacus]|uniref:TonB-dependent receptor n=1 Tax=Sulfurimicrobium lacus TaxID=2715678 RepID=A0A6F8V9M4_9PROT|nr:TonB-dependent receptor [Sulfurimicrobium lacus]BCB26543.1 hypothetical protein SKTS_14290 [Sulfurimicrobium lacus]